MPVAGFWKRLKNIGSGFLKVANFLNNNYKSLQAFADPLLDAVPYGSIAKTVLHGVSKGIDTVTSIANKFGMGDQSSNNIARPEILNDGLENVSNIHRDGRISQHSNDLRFRPIEHGIESQTQLQSNPVNHSPIFTSPLNLTPTTQFAVRPFR